MDNYISIRAAAKWLGFHDSTFRRWVKEEKIKAYRVGVRGEIRLKVSDLEGLLQSGSQQEKR